MAAVTLVTKKDVLEFLTANDVPEDVVKLFEGK